MYNERSENFSVRDLIIRVLFVALTIFILILIFPVKSDLKNINTTNNNTVVGNFSDNMDKMKDAAKDYFTLERLPKKVGDKVKITLGEMIDKKLLLPFVDSNNKQCDSVGSYVEVTKTATEYSMKINLKCTDKETYIIVPMGCYNYCEGTICEAKTETPVVNTSKYSYEYKLVTATKYSDWSAWGAWGTTIINKTDLVDVETKTEKTTKEEVKIVGYKTTTYKEAQYADKLLQISTKTITTCANYELVTTSTGTYKYTAWVATGTKQFIGSAPVSTEFTKYVYVEGSQTTINCGTCSSNIVATYTVYTRSLVSTGGAEMQCTNPITKTTPVYITTQEYTGDVVKTKTESVYGLVPIGYEIKYYRSRTRTLTSKSQTYIKWSTYGDKTLLNSGYKYTGNKKLLTTTTASK